jgi:fucose permease
LHRTFTRDERGVFGLCAGALLGLGLLEGSAGALWPDVIDAFDVSKGAFGVASGIGLSVAFPVLIFGGRITTKYDKRLLAASAATVLALACLGLTSGHGFAVLALLFVVRGVGVCLIDLTANAMAMELENQTGRHLMSPLHSGFSGGAVVGAGLAWLVFALGGGFRTVYLILVALLLSYAFMGVRERLARSQPRTRTEIAGTSVLSFHLFKRPDIRALSVLIGISFCGEILIAQWIGIYLRDEQGNSASVGVRAVILLSGAMFVGRVLNSPISNRLGERLALFIQGSLLTIGAILIVGTDNATVTITGCGVAGLGLSGIAPTALSLAGIALPEDPGAASGATLMAGYLGVAIMPFIAGGVASIASVRIVLMVEIVFGTVVVLTSIRLNQWLHTEGSGAHASLS